MPNVELDDLLKAAIRSGDVATAPNSDATGPILSKATAVPDTRTTVQRLVSTVSAPVVNVSNVSAAAQPAINVAATGQAAIVSAAGTNSAVIPGQPVTPEFDRLSAQLEQLRRATLAQSDELRDNTNALSRTGTSGPSEKTSTASNVGKTIANTVGTALGISPVITGIARLFGAFRKSEAPPDLVPFSLPSAVRLDAGLVASTQSIAPVSYGQSGDVRAISEARPASTPPPIQINVQAMDSRSFLDHSDDIAKAVKEAMLHAHSLNDVVADL
ncbi:MAG TPA: hypothetical protein VE621_12830 [Bryobacteraceae bacterium]|jgi:hypothetical protein|nr:hypothetical protein [Bryobacteraceae bacterium]